MYMYTCVYAGDDTTAGATRQVNKDMIITIVNGPPVTVTYGHSFF